MNDMSVVINLPKTEAMPLSFVTGFHEVRPLNAAYVEKLRAKIRDIGVKPYPLSVTPDGVLYGGRHRYEAFKAEGIEQCLMHITQPDSLDREAIELNRASEDALPMTFVDYAEMVWRRIGEGVKQQALADELGWSRGRVSQFAMLKDVSEEAWKIIATSVANCATDGDPCSNHNGEKVVATFTENLLRDIIPLSSEAQASVYPSLGKLEESDWDTAYDDPKEDEEDRITFLRFLIGRSERQQIELVSDLAEGKINKGKFKKLAESYRIRNDIEAWLRTQLGDIDAEFIDEGLREIAKGRYDEEWKSKPGPGEKLTKLVEALRDRFQKKHSIILIKGDFYEEAVKVGDESISAIITDPPYNISTDRVYRLATQADWDKNFGDWDNKPAAEFVSNIQAWAAEFYRIMRPGATGFMFVGEQYLNIAQSCFDQAGLEIKSTFFWCRSNPGVSVSKADFMPAMDYAMQFAKPGEKRTFNYPGEPDGFNWRQFPICGGKERLKNAKGDTLHPTQKPEAIIRHLMDIITVPGDLVFDGFMGVGTTAKVAKDMGRKFIGFELDDIYFAAAVERIEG